MVLNRIGPLSAAKVVAVLYAIFGLIMGAFFSIAALFRPDGGGLGAMWGVAAVVIFPVLYGVLGFLVTLLTTWLYNVVAGAVGGIELDLR
ncbi:MAG TPA: hypothetical protein VEP12_19390 [Candidatus Acidoferrum sp.]|jgi:hypothetical protein|nr:hypothetical protein [Candidatus Acidoferrum sp.]